MILVDYRAGSKELVAPLAALGLPVDKVTLPFGDVAFAGKGANGTSVNVGIEFKKIAEFVQATRSGRFVGHQLPGMGDYDSMWLLVEGRWQHDPKTGLLNEWACDRKKRREGWVPIRGRMSGHELEKHVFTLSHCAGVQVRFTNDRTDTLRFIQTLYRWWTDTALDKHTSHIGVHTPHTFAPITPQRRAVLAWPGVGMKGSKAVMEAFGSVHAAAQGSIEQWAELEVVDDNGKTRRFGVPSAVKVVDFLREDTRARKK